MRYRTPLLVAIATLAAPAVAAGTQGHYAGALKTMLTRTAAGVCPADMMAPGLLKACREQMPKIGPMLKAAGPIRSTTFVAADPAGRKIETYKVAFASGKTQTWHIGGLKDGKFDSAYADEE